MARLRTGCWILPLVIALNSVDKGESHGRLIEPPARSSAWRYGFNTPVDYNDNQLFCGGSSVQASAGGRCGICGDAFSAPQPRAHENGGAYGKGVIVATYIAAEIITARVQITAAHKGWFEFRLCPLLDTTKPATEECLNKNLLKQPNGNTRFEAGNTAKTHSIRLMLPPGVTCEHCVFQWRYHTGNSWGQDEFGSGLGHGHQEEFYGCADIKIVPGQRKTEEEEAGSDAGEDQETTEKEWGMKQEGREEETDKKQDREDTAEEEEWEEEDTNQNTAGKGEEQDLAAENEDEDARGMIKIPNYEARERENVKCTSAGLWKGQRGIDEWCQENCLASTQRCPETMCACFSSPSHPPTLSPALLPSWPDVNDGATEQRFACGFRSNAQRDPLLDELCVPQCNRTTGECRNTHCQCHRQDCARYVARDQYKGQQPMDLFCELRCRRGYPDCPWEICACVNSEPVRGLTCWARKGTTAARVVGFDAFCESVCGLGHDFLCPQDCECTS